jgi:hypothetical protein
LDDGGDESSLDTIWLNHDESLIFVADHLEVSDLNKHVRRNRFGKFFLDGAIDLINYAWSI